MTNPTGLLAGLLIFVGGSAGCDLTVRPFSGTILALSLRGAAPSTPGQHLELWARSQYDDIIRINSTYDAPKPGDPQTTVRLYPFGFAVRPVITLDNPCVIDDSGNLLVTAAAYPDTVVLDGVTQTPEDQAASVRARIRQLDSTSICDGSGGNPLSHCGEQASTMLGAVGWDAALATPPTQMDIPFDTAPGDRLARCKAYWDSSPFAYTGNPAQQTAPAHGQLLGAIAYQTSVPPSGYDGITITSPTSLVGARELWITVEGDTVDPLHRGPVYLQGFPDDGGSYDLHFDLRAPANSSLAVAGSAALLVGLDSNPITL
jgi:hypothetical protein